MNARTLLPGGRWPNHQNVRNFEAALRVRSRRKKHSPLGVGDRREEWRQRVVAERPDRHRAAPQLSRRDLRKNARFLPAVRLVTSHGTVAGGRNQRTSGLRSRSAALAGPLRPTLPPAAAAAAAPCSSASSSSASPPATDIAAEMRPEPIDATRHSRPFSPFFPSFSLALAFFFSSLASFLSFFFAAFSRSLSSFACSETPLL